ncbi:MAG: GNAT family N-acetyltransferase [Caulobacterales bacterium]
MRIEILPVQAMTPQLAARWRDLQGLRRAWDSPFLSPDWPLAVAAAQGPLGEHLKIAVAADGGEARAFLALRVGRVTAMPAGAPLCDNQAVVAEPGFEMDPMSLVAALGVDRLDFYHLLDDQAPFAPHVQGREVCWLIDTRDGYEAYAAARRAAGSTALRDLDKKRRKAEREVGPLAFTARSGSREDFERLFEMKGEQFRATGQTNVFAASWPMRLMRGLFEQDDAGHPGSARFGGALFTLHMAGELAAAHFHVMGARTIHAWVIAHDCAFERYSPGMLLFQDILRWMDGEAYDRVDLGSGDYRFKRELANARQGVAHGFVGAPSPAALIRQVAYGMRRAAEALPLGPVSDLPGKAMRRLDMLRGLR